MKNRIAKFKVNRVGRTKATVLLRVVGPQGEAGADPLRRGREAGTHRDLDGEDEQSGEAEEAAHAERKAAAPPITLRL